MIFEPLEKWIWLPKKQYPHNQTSMPSFMLDEEIRKNAQSESDSYTVVQCQRTYSFQKPITSLELRCSGDTFFRLCLNRVPLLSGPVAVGGDFLTNELPRPQHYATRKTITEEFTGLRKGVLDFSALIRMGPVRMNEYSQTRGGFFLTAHIRFADGEKAVVMTDESWMFTFLPAYVSADQYDAAREPHKPIAAERIPNIWHTLDSYIPPLSETRIIPAGGKSIVIHGGEEKKVTLCLGLVYSGYPLIEIHAAGPVHVQLTCMETSDESAEHGLAKESYTFLHNDTYTGLAMTSARYLRLTIQNQGKQDAILTAGFLASCYPVEATAVTTTSDRDLNLVTYVCTHTLQYCRQSIHLDSGRHCEPLACTGDYYIESLMTAFTFGDMRLSEFDVLRTAQLLRYNNGQMFHTSYSLIWVQMLWDVYMFTGNYSLLQKCEDALILLQDRFASYIGENGLIENPPNYMFVDWLNPDGISTHHPPKALGQTCLNLFYFGALQTAAKIWSELKEYSMACQQTLKASRLRSAIYAQLFDHKKGVFFEGLNTSTSEDLCNFFMPQNVSKRYYRMHANVLAAYFGFFSSEENATILETILNDEAYGVVQPYFAHFLLEAIYRNGLRDKYTLKILEDWKRPVKEYPYGLTEGFYTPEPGYIFDHSHAWGGTPAYALPLALSGIDILEPGYKRISLNPSLLGLNRADVQIPTPYGMIELSLRKGQDPILNIPSEIIYQRLHY